MWLRMENLNILRVRGKIQFLEGVVRVHVKPIYRGRLPKKGGAWTVADLRGAWQGGGGVFEVGRVDTPMHIMASDLLVLLEPK